MLHGMVTLAHTGLLPVEQVSFLLADMTYRLVVGLRRRPERGGVVRGARPRRVTAAPPIRPAVRCPSFRRGTPGAGIPPR
jgi:hypothetical protein